MAQTDPPLESWSFGPFRFDRGERRLYRGSEPVALEPKLVDTLEALLECRGQIVEKADLMRRVWPDTVVEEIGLSRNISLLRKALADESGKYIETVPKRGYRFAAAAPEPPAGTEPPSAKPPRRRQRVWIPVALGLLAVVALIYWQFYLPSPYLPHTGQVAVVAVIPVEPLSPGLERDSFPQAFTTALVAELAQFRGIQLISPSTVRRYHDFGVPYQIMTRLLGVQVILEGTAQSERGRVRVALRMSDVPTGRLIWSDLFEAPAEDRLQAQSTLARTAAEKVAVPLRAKR